MGKVLDAYYKIVFWISLIGIITFFIDLGFGASPNLEAVFHFIYFSVLGLCLIADVSRYVRSPNKIYKKAFLFDSIYLLFLLLVLISYISFSTETPLFQFLHKYAVVKGLVILAFIREVFEKDISLKRTVLNPAQFLIVSFLVFILFGAILLLLPNATVDGISFVDALFTSTSAVCLTGLVVVDTGSYFTEVGQLIILFLIQLGGIGILTFVSYFSYFFKGGASYENQLVISDIANSKSIGKVLSIAKYVIIITISIEIITGLFLYFSVSSSLFNSHWEHLFFIIFHSVSAFCNAGFSTLSEGFYASDFQFNYSFQIIIIISFILGGLGFPIVVNIINYLKYKLKGILTWSKKTLQYRPWVLNLNSRITLITTFSILAVAVVLFFIFEFDNVLADHDSYFGKIVTAFFGAATPRSAGLQTIDTSALSVPTIMLVFLLMWIGASPASMGGGIKTSTFAIATLNIISLAKGKSKIEVFRRKIAEVSVRRSFAIISLSLVVIGAGIAILSFLEPNMELRDIAFECFSAYSICGLSLGITAELGDLSKVVLVFMMFMGRLTALTILIAFFKQNHFKNYSYPEEEIQIN
jgi:trk system potassium uptake protein TrkH